MLQAVVVQEAVIDALSGRPFAVYLPVFPRPPWDTGMEAEVAVVFNVDGAVLHDAGNDVPASVLLKRRTKRMRECRIWVWFLSGRPPEE